MKSITISTQQSLSLKTKLPGDKSVSHRAMMMASLAKGTSHIRNFLNSEDCLNTVRIFKQLGVRIQKLSPHRFQVRGRGLMGLKGSPKPLDCGNSGTTMRLMAGVLAAQPFKSVLAGDASLSQRPMNRVLEPLKRMGADIRGRGRGNRTTAPLRITGRSLKGGSYRMPVASAQVKSAVLLAGLYCQEKTVVVEPVATRDHTERFFCHTGLRLRKRGKTIEMTGAGIPAPSLWRSPGTFRAPRS